jgi:hypothetical protein
MAASLIPHSFVLADLFDVASLELEVPDHVLEDEPGLEWVVCPMCEGEGWLEGSPSVWTGRPTAKPCCRCHRMGEVLDFPLALEPLVLLAVAT